MNVKLTDRRMETYGGCRWALGKEKRDAYLGEMCAKGGFHFYRDALLAVFLNSAHADFYNPLGFECVPGGAYMDAPDKSKTQAMTLVREIELPQPTARQRVLFGVLVTWRVLKLVGWSLPNWESWALLVMRGSPDALAACISARASARAAANRTYPAADAANIIYSAARAAADAYAVADVEVEAEAYSASAAESAARAYAASAAIYTGALNMVGLAHEAMR